MSGPSQAGLFIYVCDIERVAKFYEGVVGMKRLHVREDLIVLEVSTIQLLIH